MGDRILIVDDEAVLRRNLVRFLQKAGHDAVAASSGEEALELASEMGFDLVVSDLKMPGMDGIELLRHLSSSHPETLVLIVTAFASVDSAIEALRLGAQDYLLKPVVLEEVERKVSRLLRYREMEQRVRRLRQEVHQHFDTESMVARSPGMVEVMKLVKRAGASRSNVLIEGESGTGKELVARALHDGSPVAALDFIPVNLTAQPGDLVDAMLFGHERGAYTGAARARPGVFRAVSGGTVFIDEIGEMPLAVQVKLLRVIENREVLPLGSDRPVPVDFRLVVATNRPLAGLVETGEFRRDLYFRLNVLRIDLPPLRDRVGDIAPLAERFLATHAATIGKPAPRLSNEALRALEGYAWPGNVRELSNLIERAVLLSDGPWIGPDDLSVQIRDADTGGPALKPALEVFERRHIARILAECDGDKARAAELLQIHLATLYRRMERLDL